MKTVRILFTLVCAASMLTLSAFAYLDPGTGSMIVQMIIAAVLAGGASIGIFWKRIKAKLSKNKSEDAGTENKLDDEE